MEIKLLTFLIRKPHINIKCVCTHRYFIVVKKVCNRYEYTDITHLNTGNIGELPTVISNALAVAENRCSAL